MQWEYVRQAFAPIDDCAVGDLNKMGANGWELVTVVANGGTPVAYFKRPKQNAAFVDIGEPA